MKTTFSNKKIVHVVFLALTLFFIESSFAQKTWDRGANTNNWGDANNWSPNGVPTSSDDVRLIQGNTVVVNISNAVCASLALSPSNSGIAALSFNSSSQLTVSGTVSLGESGNTNRRGTLTMTNGGRLICRGFIVQNSGSNVFTPGTGTVELTADNTLPATIFTSFNNLTISLGKTTTARTLTIGLLTVNSNDEFELLHAVTANSVSLEGGCAGTGARISGSSTLTLGGNVTVTDNTGGTAGAIVSCPVSLNSATRTFTVADDGTAAADLTISGIISSGGALTKAGAGTMVLSGTNTYTGATNVNAGILNIQNAQGTGTTAGGVIVASGATLQLQGGIAVGAEALSLSGNGVDGNAAFDNISGNNSWSGAITLAADATIRNQSNNLTISGTVALGGNQLTLGGASTGGAITGVVSGAGSAVSAIRKVTAGTWSLSGANTYTGNILIQSGTLTVGNASALGANANNLSISSGAVANLTSSETVGSLSLDVIGTVDDTWGSSTSSAAYTDDTYFTSTGILTVSTDTRTTPTVTLTAGSYTFSGSPQGPNTATNTGTGTSYTYSYTGVAPTVYGPSATLPTNAGSYTVTVSVAANGNFASATSTATPFTIELAIPSVTVTVGTYTFSGSPQGPNSATNTGTGTSYTYSYVGTGGTTYTASAIPPTNVGSYTVTATVAANGNFESASSTTTPFTIGVATPSVTVTVGSYTFSGSPQGPNTATNTGTGTSYTYSYTGVAPTVYGPSATRPTNAGTYTVTATVAANGNFGSASSTATAFTIGVATPTVTVTVGSYTFSGSAQGPNTATNTGTGTSYTYSYTGVAPTVYGPSATRPTNAGSYSVIATVAANGNFSSASSSATEFSISKVSLTVTATNQTVSFGTSEATVTGAGAYTATGFVNGETAAVISGTVTYTSTYTAITNAGTSGVTITPDVSGLTAANYSFGTVTNGTITIDNATPIVTPTVGSYTYTGLPQGPNSATNTGTGSTYTYSYVGVSGTTYNASATPPTAVGSYTVTATVAADGNYSAASSVPTAFTIGKAVLTITANNQAVSYGVAVASVTGAGTYTATGFVNGETASVISGAATYTTTYTTTTASGTAGVTISPNVSGLNAANYSFVAANGTVDINTKITPTLSVTIGTYTYTGLPQGPNTATNSGTGSTYTYSYSGSGSTVYGPSATLPTVAGSYTVKATVAASIDGVYNAVTSAETAFTINKAALTLTALNTNKTYGTVRNATVSGSTAFTITSGSLKNGETIGSVSLSYGTGALAATDAVGSTSIITPSAAVGGTFSINNYTITYATGTLTVTPLAITVSAIGPSKIYGTALTAGTSTSNFTVTGTLPSGQAITSVTLTPNANGLSATTAAGTTYTVTPSLATGTGGFVASNYSITYVVYLGVVVTKALTITANGVSKVYGDVIATPETGSTLFTTSGLVGSETVGSVTLNYGSGASATSVVGTYASAVVPSAAIGGTFNAANYAITYVGGAITVTKAELTVTAQNQSKCFGANVVFFGDEFLTAGLKNADIVNTVSLSSTASSTATVAGTYDIVPSAAVGTGLSNYTITYVNGTFTVISTPAPSLSVTPASATVCSGTAVAIAATVSGGSANRVFTGFNNTRVDIPNDDDDGDASVTDFANSTIALSDATAATVSSASVISVQFSISHTNVQQLDVFLVDPSGTRGMLLTANNGGNGDNYTNTIIRTSATNRIGTSGNNSAPFTNTYAPEGGITIAPATNTQNSNNDGSYSTADIGALPLNGASINGTWSLRVFDVTGSTVGRLDNWTLTITNPGVYTSTLVGPTANETVTYTGDNNENVAISMTPPAGVNNYYVETTDAIGCSNISSAIVTTVNTAPAITVQPSAPAAVCSGNGIRTISVTATGAGLTYSWRRAGVALTNGGVISGQGTATLTLTNPLAANAGSYDVVISGTCSPTTTSNAVTLTVNPNLPASVSIVSSDADNTICAGTNVTFTATPVNGGTPSYQWRWNGTNVGTNSATYTTTGLGNNAAVSVIMTSTATCATGSPATSNTITTTVNPNLPASVSIASSDSDNAICVGTSVTFTATPTNGGTSPSYQWKLNGTNVGSNNATFTTTTLANNDIVTVVMTSNATPCMTGSPATSNSITTIVNPNVVASVSIASSDADNTICSGTSVTFTASPTNGGASPTYLWRLNNVNVGTNSPTYTTTALANNARVEVIMTSNASCVSASPATSDRITTTVNSNAVATVSIVSTEDDDDEICSGTSVTFTATPTNGGITPSYQWKLNGSNVGTNSATYTTTALNNNDAVAVVMTSSATCVTGSPANSNIINTSVSPNSVAGTVSSDQTITSGDLPSDISLIGSVGAIQWQSSTNNNSFTDIAGATSATLTGATIGTLTATTYFRAVVTSGYCSPVISSTVTVTVEAAFQVGTVSPTQQTICSGTIPSDISVVGSIGAIQWQVSTDNVTFTNIPGATSAVLSGVTIGALSTTTYFKCIVTRGQSQTGTAGTVTILMGGSTTWNGTSWSNGTPTSITSAIISGNYNVAANINACSLTVNNNAIVLIPSGYNVSLNNALTVANGSSFTLENNANLLQQGTTNSNSGAIVVKRNSSPLMRQDYTLWSSPVANQNALAFSPNTLTNRFYAYDSPTNYYNPIVPSTTVFSAGKGLLIRVPNTHPSSPTIWTGKFTGVPNNGDYKYDMYYNMPTPQSPKLLYNLVGNPYPSPISMSRFVADNSDVITGTLYFWRETNGNFYNNSYCAWAGGTFVSNYESQVVNPNGIIQTGQGFFVEAKSASPLVFKNSQREANTANQFFRTSGEEERNTIWLNAKSATGAFAQMAVGYITGATQGVDLFDGKSFGGGPIALSSVLDNANYVIQGRALPFDVSDEVPLGFKTKTAGEYSISIDHVIGLFESANQDIFIKDNLTNTVQNLKLEPYTFSCEVGEFNSRFSLVFKDATTLATDTFQSDANLKVVFTNNDNMITLKNTDVGSRVLTVSLYNLVGQVISSWDVKNENQQSMQLQVRDLATGTYVVKVTTTKGISSKKIIIKNTKMTLMKKKIEKELPKERSILADED